MEAKAELRRAIKERLQRMTDNDRRVESNIIVRELRKLIPDTPSTIAVYLPYTDEPDITPLINELLEQKNVICLGKIDGNRMVMHQIDSLADITRHSVTGIPEPASHAPIADGAVDIAIVPGRAFTSDCMRMGRGNGGYDLWIGNQAKQGKRPLCIGVCFDCQLVQKLPLERHDEAMDIVVTSSQICKKG